MRPFLPPTVSMFTKRAENINFAMPQDPALAAVLGATMGPMGAGMYGGLKGDSFRQGLRAAGSTAVGDVAGTATGGVLGALLGGLSTAGVAKLLNLLNAGGRSSRSLGDFASGGATVGALTGAGLGGMIGRALMANRSSKSYNNKLEAKRDFQKAVSGGARVNVYNGLAGDSEEEREIEKASNMRPFLPPKQANFGAFIRAGLGKAFTATGLGKAVTATQPLRNEAAKLFESSAGALGKGMSDGIRGLNRQVMRIPGMDKGFLNREATRYLRDPFNQTGMGVATIGGLGGTAIGYGAANTLADMMRKRQDTSSPEPKPALDAPGYPHPYVSPTVRQIPRMDPRHIGMHPSSYGA